MFLLLYLYKVHYKVGLVLLKNSYCESRKKCLDVAVHYSRVGTEHLLSPSFADEMKRTHYWGITKSMLSLEDT